MTRRTLLMTGLVMCLVLLSATTVYLFALGLRLDGLASGLAPEEMYLGSAGVLVGVLGAAVLLGLLLRPAAPVREEHAPGEMPDA